MLKRRRRSVRVDMTEGRGPRATATDIRIADRPPSVRLHPMMPRAERSEVRRARRTLTAPRGRMVDLTVDGPPTAAREAARLIPRLNESPKSVGDAVSAAAKVEQVPAEGVGDHSSHGGIRQEASNNVRGNVTCPGNHPGPLVEAEEGIKADHDVEVDSWSRGNRGSLACIAHGRHCGMRSDNEGGQRQGATLADGSVARKVQHRIVSEFANGGQAGMGVVGGHSSRQGAQAIRIVNQGDELGELLIPTAMPEIRIGDLGSGARGGPASPGHVAPQGGLQDPILQICAGLMEGAGQFWIIVPGQLSSRGRNGGCMGIGEGSTLQRREDLGQVADKGASDIHSMLCMPRAPARRGCNLLSEDVIDARIRIHQRRVGGDNLPGGPLRARGRDYRPGLNGMHPPEVALEGLQEQDRIPRVKVGWIHPEQRHQRFEARAGVGSSVDRCHYRAAPGAGTPMLRHAFEHVFESRPPH